jgi:hypothetical protein
MLGRAAIGLALAVVGSAQAQEVSLRLATRGALTITAAATHVADGAHFCSAAPDPWRTPDERDPRGPPYPFYRLIYGQDSPEAEPEKPGPSLGLTLSNYLPSVREHSDPNNDSIELTIEGRHFVGHVGLDDPAYRFAVTFREDRRGGGFVAHHLHENGTGDARLDVEGSWECPAVAADLPEAEVAEHRLFPGAVPAHAEGVALRLSRSDIPCVDRHCAAWRVTDEATGDAYLARVDFRRVRLARTVREHAEQRLVDLLVDAEVRAGRPPRVIVIALSGVLPRSAPFAADAAAEHAGR